MIDFAPALRLSNWNYDRGRGNFLAKTSDFPLGIHMASLGILNRIRHVGFVYDASVAIRDRYSFLKGLWTKNFSQHGEDHFIQRFFAETSKGHYVDIGASHPFRISNTYGLYRKGWSGVTVEPIPRLAKLHRRWRPRDTILPVAVGLEEGALDFFEMTPSVLSTLDTATAEKYIETGRAILHKKYNIDVMVINDILEHALCQGEIDFISIDIEGLDERVIEMVDFSRFRPKLICVEVSDSSVSSRVKNILSKVGYLIKTEIGCNLMAVSTF